MLGITNAQGVSGPYLEEELLAQDQNLLIELDEIRAQLAALRKEYDRMRKNPHLGEIVNYAGFDWIVCHADYESEIYYLALKNIYEMTKFSEGSLEFRGSILEERLKYFERVLMAFSMGMGSAGGLGEKELEAVSFHTVTYENGNVYSSTTYAFVPTYQQISEEFDLFKGNRFGRTVASLPGSAVTSNFNSGDLIVEHSNRPWWTCSVGSHDNILTVYENGSYTTATSVSAPTAERGFRPFICMKMR